MLREEKAQLLPKIMIITPRGGSYTPTVEMGTPRTIPREPPAVCCCCIPRPSICCVS